MPPFEIDSLNSLKQFEGREFPATEWFVIAQDRIQKFADATEDRQWIHVNPERAQSESPFGGSVAHGFLTLSLLSHFLKQAIHIRSGVAMSVNYGLNKVRFPSPVRAGSAVRARVTLLSAKLPEKESGESMKEEVAEFAEKEVGEFTKKDSRGFVDAAFLIHVASDSAEKPCCVAEWLIRYYPQ
ncbi:MAG: MaoC family dehydratase [Candidatus Sulfotelmatobacter sp.]